MPPIEQNRDRTAWRSRPLAAAVAALAIAVSILGSWTPSFWSDEVATLRAARLPWASLIEFVQHKDAVHAVYYAAMHLWIGAFGQTEFAVRSLSCLAVGMAAGGLVILGSHLRDTRLGIVAGMVFAILPRTTYMGIEGRSYALTAALAVWFCVALVAAIGSSKPANWVLYGVVGAISFYTFVYLVLIVPIHLIAVVAGPRRRAVLGWSVSTAIALTASLPILIVANAQKDQLSWLSTQPVVNVWTILVEPYFDSSWLTAGAVLVILFIEAGLVVSRRLIRYLRPGTWLALAWTTLPLAALLTANGVDGPLYLARYLSFCTPGIALLIAGVATHYRAICFPVALVLAIAATSAPTYLSQRTAYAKNGGSDLREVAQYIEGHASPGDAFYFDETGPTAQRPRLALYAYPQDFQGLVDVGLISRLATAQNWSFQDRTLSQPAMLANSTDIHRLWLISPAPSSCSAQLPELSSTDRLVLLTHHRTHRETICEYIRKSPQGRDEPRDGHCDPQPSTPRVANTIGRFSRVVKTVDEPDGAEAGEFLVQLEIPENMG